MSWVTLVWAMLIGACVAMALPQVLLWIWQRRAAQLFFAIATTAVIGIAVAELAVMHSHSVEQMATVIRWAHVPIFALVVGIVGFVRFYFGTGRWWLAVAACAVRFLCLVINFALPPNLNFRAITSIRPINFLGDIVSMPVGVVTPWTHLGELSSLLALIFVVDASISLWRQGKPEARSRALIVGGSITLFILLAAGVSALIHLHVIEAPYLISFPFAAIVTAMAFELGRDMLAALQVAQKLRQSEATLHESEERFRIMADAAPVLIWMAGPDKLCIFFNKTWLDFTGRTMAQELGNGWADGVHPDDFERCLKTYVTAFDAREQFVIQYRLRRYDGEYRWISDRGVPRQDAQGNFAGYIGSAVDITDLLKKEDEARRRRDEINRLSRMSLLGEMTASIAHEVNQPLSGILSNASAGQRFIDRGNVDLAKIREILVDVGADGRRAYDVIQNIRNIVKKGTAIRRQIDLNDVVTKVTHMLQPDTTAQSCELEISLEKNLPMIEADPVQIQEVLINLVSNSLDAMRETPLGQREVQIVTERNGESTVCVSVRDRGGGIADEMRERLFEQFSTTKEDGLGMGLAIVRSIVERHGGTVEAENVAGGGARFSFTLPLSK